MTRSRQRTLPGLTPEPKKITRAETFAAVQAAFLKILKQRGHATADAIRDLLEIPKAGLPAIGRAIAHLHQIGMIEPVYFDFSRRAKAHGRPLRVWRLSKAEGPAT